MAERKHTDRMRELADYIEGLEETSEVTENHVHVNLVDQTGRFAAVEATTKRDNPKPSSIPPSKAALLRAAINRMPPWGVVIAILAGLLAYVVIRLKLG